MSAPVTRTARLAAEAIMSAATTGFNATFAALAGAYGVDPFELDFASATGNVVRSYVQETDSLDLCGVIGPHALSIYTSAANDEQLFKPTRFSGRIPTHLDFFFRFRVNEGFSAEVGMRMGMEDLADCVIGAMVDVFGAARFAPPSGVQSVGAISCQKMPVVFYEQGVGQVFKCTVPIGVSINAG